MFTTFNETIKNVRARFVEELAKVRTGRAHPGLIADVKAAVYGATMSLKELANIIVADTRMLAIEPWDKSILKDIERALIEADLNISPVIDGTIIRLKLPELTEETRTQLVRKLREKLEEARVAVRRVREETKKKLDAEKRSGMLPEDKHHKSIEELDELTREAIDELEAQATMKEKEVMTV